MREIKFRAWDRILKKMTYGVSMKLREHEYINILDMFTILNQRYDFMQYTGLKDKNGKEIYERDILTSAFSKRIVIFDENTCSFMLKDIGLRNELFSLTNEKCKNLEIIEIGRAHV